MTPGAAISRFAMRQGDRWQEGEVVELQAAREAYEDFLHRRQDPALLEKAAGNSFRARVFPIPASGDKELIVSFSQERGHSADPYRIFLRGLPELANLDLRVLLGKTAGGGASSSLGGSTVSYQTIEVKKDRFKPDRDFEVAVPAASDGRVGLRHDNLAVARITPVATSQPDPIGGLLVLFDTSASRALGFASQVDHLQALLGGLARDPATAKAPLKILCFDQEVEEVFSGSIAGFGARDRERHDEKRIENKQRRLRAGLGDIILDHDLHADHPVIERGQEENDQRRGDDRLGDESIGRIKARADFHSGHDDEIRREQRQRDGRDALGDEMAGARFCRAIATNAGQRGAERGRHEPLLNAHLRECIEPERGRQRQDDDKPACRVRDARREAGADIPGQMANAVEQVIREHGGDEIELHHDHIRRHEAHQRIIEFRPGGERGEPNNEPNGAEIENNTRRAVHDRAEHRDMPAPDHERRYRAGGWFCLRHYGSDVLALRNRPNRVAAQSISRAPCVNANRALIALFCPCPACD